MVTGDIQIHLIVGPQGAAFRGPRQSIPRMIGWLLRNATNPSSSTASILSVRLTPTRLLKLFRCSSFNTCAPLMPRSWKARECSVRKKTKSFSGSRPNRATALSFASCAALRVNAKYPILLGGVPSASNCSTWLRRVVVLPVPGGPKYLNILFHPYCVEVIAKSLEQSLDFINGKLTRL